MSLCFSHSISSSFTPTYKRLFIFFNHLQLHSLLTSSSSSPFVSKLVLSSTSSWARKYISRNMSSISYDVLKFFRYLALPIRRPIFLTLDTLKNFSILESYFRHLCDSPFWFLRRLLSCLFLSLSLTLFVPLSLYRFSKIQISKFLIVISTRSLENSPMIPNDWSI